ncbi:Cytochrome P450 OS=Streptomyces tendae OX=1932 GN=GUR47_25270 PE=3 SV=1 [Streptomyces tendae]
MEPRIASLTRELLDAVDDRHEIELIGDFAQPLPITVIALLLGVPRQDRALFWQWADELFPGTEPRRSAATRSRTGTSTPRTTCRGG